MGTKEGIDIFDDDDTDDEKDGDNSDKEKNKEERKAKQEKLNEDFKPTTEFLEALLQGKINKAQVTTLLTSSPAALVQGAYGMSPTMQRYMKAQTVATTGAAMGGQFDEQYNQAILEINPDNVIIQDLKRMVEDDDPEKENFGMLLYDVAAMSSGYDLEDISDFSKRVMKLMNSKAVQDDDISTNDTTTKTDDEDDDDVEVAKEVEVL